MADLIFCLTFLRLQVSLEERPVQHGIASGTTSANKDIFRGQHDEDLLFNSTRRLHADVEEGAATLETLAGPLRVVDNYRHLGCRVDCTRTQNTELATQAATAALGHSLFADGAIPTRVRTNVARSTVHNRLLQQAGQ